MKAKISVVVMMVATMFSTTAWGWGEPGHQLIGSIAYALLTPNAKAHVDQLLGPYSLSVATTWADCDRDVRKSGGSYSYEPGPKTPTVCKTFQTPAEEAAMVYYANHNWDDCVYTPTEGCLGAYHFSDIAFERGTYQPNVTGWATHDVVHAINAAITVLQCDPAHACPAPSPFLIKDHREALLLLAHFVGDIHQPLHVGAIYLDANGAVQDPDMPAKNPNALATRGGNSLTFGSKELHGDWDTIQPSLGITATPALITEARAVPKSTKALSTWAGSWANNSVALAGSTAFRDLSFGPQSGGHWSVDFSARPKYEAEKRAAQRIQLVAAGAHLAQVLNAIWP